MAYLYASWANDDSHYRYQTMVTYQVDDGLSIGGIIDIDIDKVIDIVEWAYVPERQYF